MTVVIEGPRSISTDAFSDDDLIVTTGSASPGCAGVTRRAGKAHGCWRVAPFALQVQATGRVRPRPGNNITTKSPMSPEVALLSASDKAGRRNRMEVV